MAEAIVESREETANNRFYCHQCSVEIQPKLPDFTCPECDNGFIEEIDVTTDAIPESSSSQQTHGQQPIRDPAAQFAELWGRAFLESFQNHSAERDEGVAWARDRDSDEEQEGSTRRNHRAFPASRVSFRRNRPLRNHYLQGLFQYVSDHLDQPHGAVGGSRFTMQGIPINILPVGLHDIHGNPQDYAWGAGGLDAIITQLLNQLEGSGAPPAQKEKIDALPSVRITQKQCENGVQCSVCMDDFHLDEEVKKLPCDHHYHTDCIIPWLKLHGTCPVCRKDLNGEDTSLKDTITPIQDNGSPTDSESQNGLT